MKQFGAPLRGVKIKDFTNRKIFYQIGVAPVRVDITMGLGGIDFNDAWKNRKRTKYGNISINILGLKELVKSKKIFKRKQDKLDLEKLAPLLKKS